LRMLANQLNALRRMKGFVVRDGGSARLRRIC
jgi:hypothetical protein